MHGVLVLSGKCRVVARLVLIALVLIAFHLIQEVRAQEVIVNPNVQETTLNRSALRAIFSMRLRTWPDGTLIKVFVLDDNSPLHTRFSKKILNIFPYQLRRTWDRLVYSGTGQAPIEVDSIQEMFDRVASTSGAIGYLSEEVVDADMHAVKVVQVE